MRKALHLPKEQQNMEDFTVSNGWIQNFMRRVLQARILSKRFCYQPCNIIAMDETAI